MLVNAMIDFKQRVCGLYRDAVSFSITTERICGDIMVSEGDREKWGSEDNDYKDISSVKVDFQVIKV